MATLDFKNVGTRVTDAHFSRKTNPVVTIPFGFKTPLQLSNSAAHPFAMHYDLADQIHDNLKNLLLTNWGERVGFYRFGANLRPLMFDLTAEEEFDLEAAIRIKTAVERYMPWIELQGFSSTVETQPGDNVASVSIIVTYGIAKLNVTNKALQIVFHLGG